MARRKSKRTEPIGPFGVGDLPTSMLFIFPLFLFYQVGVMFSVQSMNGVDFVTHWVYAALGYDRQRYLWAHGGLALVFVGLLIYLRRTRSFSLKSWPPVFLESAIYALTLGTAITLVMGELLGFAAAALPEGFGDKVIISLGAGVHEEVVFRLGMMGGAAALLLKMGVNRWLGFAIAIVLSSVLFSAAHHIPPGPPFETYAFVYRVLAGLAFGLIFYFRSLAHAVYAHAMYDIYVFVLT